MESIDREVVAQLRARASSRYPDFFQEMARLFIAEMERWLRTMSDALKGNDAALLARAAHALGGGAMIFGASRLVQMCGVLQATGSAESEETRSLVDEIESECAEVRRILEEELETGKAHS